MAFVSGGDILVGECWPCACVPAANCLPTPACPCWTIIWGELPWSITTMQPKAKSVFASHYFWLYAPNGELCRPVRLLVSTVRNEYQMHFLHEKMHMIIFVAMLCNVLLVGRKNWGHYDSSKLTTMLRCSICRIRKHFIPVYILTLMLIMQMVICELPICHLSHLILIPTTLRVEALFWA